MQNMTIFVEILLDYFIQNDTNAHNFAKNVGSTDCAIGKWIKGTDIPTLQKLIKVADFFNCSIDYLLGRSSAQAITKSASAKTFAQILGYLIEQNKISLYRLAKLCNISNSTISKWLKHGKIPKIETIVKLSELFSCSVDYLIGRSDIK